MMDRVITGSDGSAVYVTADGDMVDHVAYRYYGRHGANTEAVLEANPGLAARGPVLPAGVAIKLPRIIQSAAPKEFRRLWD